MDEELKEAMVQELAATGLGMALFTFLALGLFAWFLPRGEKEVVLLDDTV